MSVHITAIIVTYNEEEYLEECIKNISFCAEILVVDLGSEDQSVEIAESLGADVICHQHVEIAHEAQSNVIDCANNDWILFIDPDEVFHPALADKAARVIKETSDVGQIAFPLKFYFRERGLDGTWWGGQEHKTALIHRERCEITEYVHRPFQLRPNYREVKIPWEEPEHHIRHYWIDSYSELFEKHWRYVRHEGESRFDAGTRFSWASFVHRTLSAFKNSYIDQDGWREGGLGLFLSAFWACYEAGSLLSLRQYQKNRQVGMQD